MVKKSVCGKLGTERGKKMPLLPQRTKNEKEKEASTAENEECISRTLMKECGCYPKEELPKFPKELGMYEKRLKEALELFYEDAIIFKNTMAEKLQKRIKDQDKILAKVPKKLREKKHYITIEEVLDCLK